MKTESMPLITGALRLPSMNFRVASTMDEALTVLAKDPDARPIAGGTNLVPRLMSRHFNVKTLVDLSDLNECRYVRRDKDSIKIGALTTLAELVESPYMQHFDAIKSFEREFVSPPIMNLATVGGSIALGDYAQDIVVILESLGAKLKVSKNNEYEIVLLDSRIRSPIKTSGLIIEVDFPFPRDNNLLCFFDKLNPSVSRIPYASLALKTELERDVFTDVTLVANCAKGTTPDRLFETENVLTNSKFEKGVIANAVAKLEEEAEPHSDFLAPGWYRKRALGALLRKVSSRAVEKVISGV